MNEVREQAETCVAAGLLSAAEAEFLARFAAQNCHTWLVGVDWRTVDEQFGLTTRLHNDLGLTHEVNLGYAIDLGALADLTHRAEGMMAAGPPCEGNPTVVGSAPADVMAQAVGHRPGVREVEEFARIAACCYSRAEDEALLRRAAEVLARLEWERNQETDRLRHCPACFASAFGYQHEPGCPLDALIRDLRARLGEEGGEG